MLNQMLLTLALTSPTALPGAHAPLPAEPVAQRIYTLTWTDVHIPARVAVPSAAPAAVPTPMIFTLAWQPATGGSASSQHAHASTPASPRRATWTTLIEVPRE